MSYRNHRKVAVIDGRIGYSGGLNMTEKHLTGTKGFRSFSINYETNLVIYDEDITRELEADFEADLEHCVPFSAEEYEARSRASRFVDSTVESYTTVVIRVDDATLRGLRKAR